jgi:hypothetical protein
LLVSQQQEQLDLLPTAQIDEQTQGQLFDVGKEKKLSKISLIFWSFYTSIVFLTP